jgi:hypothetical protein
MKGVLKALAFFVVFCPLVGTAQQGGRGRPHVESALTVCEVLAHASQYDGKVIQIRARTEGTDEGWWFIGDGCDGVFVTEEQRWPSAIAIGSAPVPNAPRSADYVHVVDFEFNFESLNILQRRLELLRQSVPPGCIEVIYTGLFETRSDWTKAKVTYPDGHSTFFGFGHLGGAPGQLIPKSADDARAIAGCGEKALRAR